MVSNSTLVKIAAYGGIIVSATGFYLQNKIIDRVREHVYYKTALKKLRTHAGAVFYLGEPIKDYNFKLSDAESNSSSTEDAHFCIPIKGPKDKGHYYFWAHKIDNEWKITKAELKLNSKPDQLLVIVKEQKDV